MVVGGNEQDGREGWLPRDILEEIAAGIELLSYFILNAWIIIFIFLWYLVTCKIIKLVVYICVVCIVSLF